MQMWTQQTNLSNQVKNEFAENDTSSTDHKQYLTESYNAIQDVKIRTSIGSCGDDSGVVNSISTDGTSSSSNTPPTVYQSPPRNDNLNVYQPPTDFNGFANPYYYSQNYRPYHMMPPILRQNDVNANFNDKQPYQYNCYPQPINGFNGYAQFHPNPYANNPLFSQPQPQPNTNLPTAYYENVNITYNYDNIYKSDVKNAPLATNTKIMQITPLTASSPIPIEVPAIPSSSSKNNNLNKNTTIEPCKQLLNNTANSTNNPNIKVKLQDMSLWKSFHEIGTEMIITKTGRRMFPSLRVSVSGLEANSKYIMFIDVVPYDDNRYKYHNSEWIISGKAEPHFGGRAYLHPDSPMSGSQWSKQIISFHKLKLTNNPLDRQGHIVLNSMHKYIPRIHIVEEGKSLSTFTFNETIFTAVTAYQNEKITKLKIEYNPFAKGFRDGQNRKDYRSKRNSDEQFPCDVMPPAQSYQMLQQQQQQQNHHYQFN